MLALHISHNSSQDLPNSVCATYMLALHISHSSSQDLPNSVCATRELDLVLISTDFDHY